MEKLERFVSLLTGHFDNREQFGVMKDAGTEFPYAEHVNTVCNDKIQNLPKDFKGLFVVEESYYASMGQVNYEDLKKSERFTPALYREKDGVWEGGSVSQFSPVMKMKLWEKFSDSCLEVSESMEVQGKRTFGYDVPIVYKRVLG